MMRDVKGLKRSKKHVVHDVADYHDRRAESIKNLIELGTDLRKVENGRPQYDREIPLGQAAM